ncbi:acyl--CoA ligase [Methylosoma difficile]
MSIQANQIKQANSNVAGIYGHLQKHFDLTPNKVAVVCDGVPYSYLQIQEKIKACLCLLEKQADKQPTVAILFPNSIEFIAATLATFAINGIVVALNPNFTEAEIQLFLASSHANVVFAKSKTVEQLDLTSNFTGLLFTETDLLEAEALDCLPVLDTVNISLPALYMFSSGSTGKSKRVTRTQEQILNEYNSLTNTVGISSSDCFLCTIPLYHAHGLSNALLAALLSGGQLVMLTTEFNARRTLQALVNYGVTIYPAVPFMFKVLAGVKFEQPPELGALRLLISAGAPLPQAVADDFYTKFNKPISQLYGSTETGAITLNHQQAVIKPLSVGLPMAGVQVGIRDDEGNVQPAGSEGEIWISSPAMTSRYDDHAELSQSCFVDHWFFAGDLGHLDDDGYLFITGRKKLLFIVAGNKVDPLEVEEVIGSYPKVQESVVVGVDHADYGQMLKAFVVLVEGMDCTETEIIDYAKASLAEYKIPKRVEFIAEIPRSPLGKILRKYLQ